MPNLIWNNFNRPSTQHLEILKARPGPNKNVKKWIADKEETKQIQTKYLYG